MRSSLLLLILATGLAAQTRDSVHIRSTSTEPTARYKRQYLMFPAIGCGIGSFLLFKKVSDLRDDANMERFYGRPKNADKFDKEADQKTLFAAGLAVSAAVLVWLAFQPSYEFPEGKIVLTPTTNSIVLSYRF